MPNTSSVQFVYADDLPLAVSHNTVEKSEGVLTSDLTPNLNKTEWIYFHPNNKEATRKLGIRCGDYPVSHNPTSSQSAHKKQYRSETVWDIIWINSCDLVMPGPGACLQCCRVSLDALVYHANNHWLYKNYSHTLPLRFQPHISAETEKAERFGPRISKNIGQRSTPNPNFLIHQGEI
ncbi:hypothetical protein Trydic_g12187 [Trypoxylus dichotomus]